MSDYKLQTEQNSRPVKDVLVEFMDFLGVCENVVASGVGGKQLCYSKSEHYFDNVRHPPEVVSALHCRSTGFKIKKSDREEEKVASDESVPEGADGKGGQICDKVRAASLCEHASQDVVLEPVVRLHVPSPAEVNHIVAHEHIPSVNASHCVKLMLLRLFVEAGVANSACRQETVLSLEGEDKFVLVQSACYKYNKELMQSVQSFEFGRHQVIDGKVLLRNYSGEDKRYASYKEVPKGQPEGRRDILVPPLELNKVFVGSKAKVGSK